MKDIKIGIIGCGLLGNTHVMALNTIIEEEYFKNVANIEITAYCDINADHLKEYNSRNDELPEDHIFTDYKDLLNCPDVNTVYIVTPTNDHQEIFLAAAEAGKDIFCEKPLTDPLSGIDKMIEARDKAKIKCQVGLVLRYSPIFRYVKTLLEDETNQKNWGALQNVIFRDDQQKPYSGSGTHPSVWRGNPEKAFHGTLFEHSIHDVDIMMYWLGPITEVYSHIKYFAKIDSIEDSVSANFELKNGASASLTSIWHNVSHDSRHFELFFENAFLTVDFDMTTGNLEIVEVGSRKKKIKPKDMDLALRESMNIADHPQFWLSAYGYEDIAFIRSLIDEKPPSPSLEDARNAHEIVQACYDSAKSKKLIILEK
jgi:predicted dehydrogenase